MIFRQPWPYSIDCSISWPVLANTATDLSRFYIKFVLRTLGTLDTEVKSFQAGEMGPDIWTSCRPVHMSSPPLQMLAFRTLKHVNLILRYNADISWESLIMTQNVATHLEIAKGLETLKLCTEGLGKAHPPEIDFLRPLATINSESEGWSSNRNFWVSVQRYN